MSGMREVTAHDGTSLKVFAPDISDWTEIRHEYDRRNGDLYIIYATGEKDPIGSLQFLKGFPEPGSLSILQIGVRPKFQGKGVASALLERLRVDHPDWKIDPGVCTELGLAFTRRILDREPEAQVALAPTYEGKTVGY